MAGKGYFICRGNEHHILLYDTPDGETVESFAEKTPCKECGAKIDWSSDSNL